MKPRLVPHAATGELVDPDPRHFVALRIRQLLAKGESPLEFMLMQMQDPANSIQFRVYCAVQAAPYIHAKATPEAADSKDPHEAFLEHVEGLRARLMGRLLREVAEPDDVAAESKPTPIAVPNEDPR